MYHEIVHQYRFKGSTSNGWNSMTSTVDYKVSTMEFLQADYPESGRWEFNPDPTTIKREWPAFAWPGGYEIHYIVGDCGVLCYQCANEEFERTLDPDDDQFHIVAQEINYEDNHLQCDHCNRQILPAYGPEDDEDQDDPVDGDDDEGQID